MMNKSSIITGFTSTAAAIGLLLSAGVSQAQSRWSHTYYCEEYTVTLNEYAAQTYAYAARGVNGDLALRNGRRRNTGAAWVYVFRNGNYTYEIEDAWNSAINPGGRAALRVYQNGRLTLNQTCRKNQGSQSSAPTTYFTPQNANQVAVSVIDNRFSFAAVLSRSYDDTFIGIDPNRGRIRAIFNAATGRLVLINQQTGQELYNYFPANAPAMPSSGATPPPNPPGRPPGRPARMADDSILLAEPNLSSPVIGQVAAGTPVTILRENNYYFYILVGDRDRGWVSGCQLYGGCE